VEACEALGRATELFPLDPGIRKMSKDCEPAQ
jgi:hypothetical protein